MTVNIYELISEVNASSLENKIDNLKYSFNQSNRAKLEDSRDLEVFDLLGRIYGINIIYRYDRRDGDKKIDYWKYDKGEIQPFTATELEIFDSLDWTRLPHNLKAQVYDAIWICNHSHVAAEIAVEEYYELYREWFDEVHWVKCVNYINRAIELAAKTGNNDKKIDILTKVYADLVRMNGNDDSFLSISLIKLIVGQNFSCDYNVLIFLADKLILKNEGSIRTSHILQQAYYVKASIYKKLKDAAAENNVYVQYADSLMCKAEDLVSVSGTDEKVDNRNWFIAENDIKQAIGLFQNHGAPERAVNAQKRLVEIQKNAMEHVNMQEFKVDVSDLYKKFCDEYANHDIHELIWDVVFAFRFQNKNKIRKDVIENATSISQLIPMQILDLEGQTVFSLPSLDLDDENNIMLHMYHKANEYERITGRTIGVWFIQCFRKLDLQEADLNMIFENNPIIPKGQEKDVQRGVFYGLIGNMSDSLDKLAPKTESIIRNLAEMCGDLMTYYDAKEGIQKKKVLSQVFIGKKLNECINEDVLFTFDGLLQQKSGANIRNRIGHGLNTESECASGECIYFVMILLKFCALYCGAFGDEYEKRKLVNGTV